VAKLNIIEELSNLLLTKGQVIKTIELKRNRDWHNESFIGWREEGGFCRERFCFWYL